MSQTLPIQIKHQNGGVLWLGEHHNSLSDHNLQASIIESVYQTRISKLKSSNEVPPMAIGLEQVQVQFQPMLDMYVSGRISEDDLLQNVQWEKRWSWSFDNYRPVFESECFSCLFGG